MEYLHAPLQPSAGSALPSSHCSKKKKQKNINFFFKTIFFLTWPARVGHRGTARPPRGVSICAFCNSKKGASICTFVLVKQVN
jgi:hypothetical protein